MNLRLALGGVGIALGSRRALSLPKHYRAFAAPVGAPMHVRLSVSHSAVRAKSRPVIQSPSPLWQLSQDDEGRWLFIFPGRRAALLSSSLDSGVLYSPRLKSPLAPWYYPLDQCLCIQFFPSHGRLLVHAAAVLSGGKGYLLLGNSGAGKSTLAGLWAQADSSALILSDERVIVFRSEGRWRMSGTPWPGTGNFASPATAPIAGCFFLEHAKENGLSPLKSGLACAHLMRCAFPPLWDREGLRLALQLAGHLSQAVPCSRYGFLPDRSAVDFLQHAS